MEDARGETNILLELLLDPAAPGAFLKDHLLVHLILSKGIGGNQISSGRERPRLARPQSLGLVLLFVQRTPTPPQPDSAHLTA